MNLNYQRWPDRHTSPAERALHPLDTPHRTAAAAAHGSDETIPPTFVVMFDLLALCVAFALTRPLAPFVQWLLLPSGPLRMPLPMWLDLPGNTGPGDFSALPSFIW